MIDASENDPEAIELLIAETFARDPKLSLREGEADAAIQNPARTSLTPSVGHRWKKPGGHAEAAAVLRRLAPG